MIIVICAECQREIERVPAKDGRDTECCAGGVCRECNDRLRRELAPSRPLRRLA